jgi:hypothetical protein
MRTFKEVLVETFMEIISHYQQKLNVREDSHFVESRPGGILELEERLLRRELILAANEGDTKLVTQITDHLTKPHELVLFAGFVSMLELNSDYQHEPGSSAYYLPVNENGRAWLEMGIRAAN